MILVTGAAGFIGSNIVSRLNELGQADVVACDVLGSGTKWLNLRKCQVRDIVPPATLPTWLASKGGEITAVVHMGAESSTMASDGDDVIERNFRYSVNLLDWCTAHHVPFIYASSAATYGDGNDGFDDDWSLKALRKLRPLNLYGWSKHLFDLEVSHRHARGDRMPPACVGLKFFNVYGPNEYHKGPMMSVLSKYFEQARAGSPISLFKSHRQGIADGGQKRDFVYIRDVVDIVLWFVDRGRDTGIFNLGSGRARSFEDLIGTMFDALGMPRQISYVDMPESLRDKYQYFTEARMDRIRALGFGGNGTSLENGVTDFVGRYLNTDDPYR